MLVPRSPMTGALRLDNRRAALTASVTIFCRVDFVNFKMKFPFRYRVNTLGTCLAPECSVMHSAPKKYRFLLPTCQDDSQFFLCLTRREYFDLSRWGSDGLTKGFRIFFHMSSSFFTYLSPRIVNNIRNNKPPSNSIAKYIAAIIHHFQTRVKPIYNCRRDGQLSHLFGCSCNYTFCVIVSA